MTNGLNFMSFFKFVVTFCPITLHGKHLYYVLATNANYI